jgi:hypothetical protein
MRDVLPFSAGKAHYHIRWPGDRLDLKRFDTQLEANTHAQNSARQGEIFTIERFDGTCRACRVKIFSGESEPHRVD